MSSAISFGDGNSGFQAGIINGPVNTAFQLPPNLNNVLNSLPFAKDAPFYAYQRRHDPTCLPDTRVDLLQEIYSWADGEDSPSIFWLSGLAGTGKSTIARTLVAKYSQSGGIAASFFFSRDGGEGGHLHHAGMFVTSLAVQLANNVQRLKQTVCDAISAHSDIAHRALREQWRHLILSPLSTLGDSNGASRYILVVDALDECENKSDIQTILQLLAEARSLVTVQLRVFLTSRPEVPIRNGFVQIPDAAHQDFILHNISSSIVDHDIYIFLEYNLKRIGQEHSLDAGWPGEEVIRLLVQIASGLFIWAATACRFIREGKRFAAKRLDMILRGTSSTITAPEKYLDQIYITVLKHSISPEYTDEEKEESHYMLREVLGSTAILFSPLSAYSLSGLLNVAKEDIYQTLDDLHSVLDVPKDQIQPLRLHHPSFRDFLLNHDRCKDQNFWVDEKQAHRTLAERCIQLLSTSLKQDICGFNAPGVRAADVDSSRVEQCLPPEVQYACLYWIQHLQNSGAQLYDNDRTHQFLEVHLLHWLEALSWMRKTSEGIYAINMLESITLTSNCPDLCAFIHDIKRFSLHGRSAIEQAPLQVYCSALVFTPMTSIVKRQFKDRMSQWIKEFSEIEEDWSTLLQTLEGHSGSVNAVAFSWDGKMLASGSDDRTVKLWDAKTGIMLQTLEGHSGRVSAVTFSPDGKMLASASADETVKLWNASTGAVLHTLEGHSGRVTAVSFSPGGKVLTSASEDETVKLWDASTGTVLQTLEGHSHWVMAVVFSPDGKVLASASADETVKLWDTSTGAVLQTLKGHSGGVTAVVFSLDGKALASASGDKTVKLWDAKSGITLQTLEGHSRRVTAVAFLLDGKVLASASGDETVKLWNASTGAVLQTLQSHSGWVNAVALSPDGKVLASASEDETVKLWDVGTRAVLQTPKGHSGRVIAVAFSPDGKVLASASEDATVKLWDARTGIMLQTLKGHSGRVSAVTFSPDGKMLASASADETVKLWNASTGAVLHTLEGHSGRIIAVAFSPDGKVLASSSGDKTVKLWAASIGAMLQTLKVNTVVHTLSFSKDGTSIQTNRGVLHATSFSYNDILPRSCPSHGIFVKEHWVRCGIDDLLWLPPEYRPSCTAVYGSVVALGHSTGHVLILEFAF